MKRTMTTIPEKPATQASANTKESLPTLDNPLPRKACSKPEGPVNMTTAPVKKKQTDSDEQTEGAARAIRRRLEIEEANEKIKAEMQRREEEKTYREKLEATQTEKSNWFNNLSGWSISRFTMC